MQHHHRQQTQQTQQQPRHTLLYSDQCPNCLRFIEALSRTPVAREVALVDVRSVRADQLENVKAVPALLTDGDTLYGTSAFEWLKQFEADVELEGFAGGGGGGGLAFSDVTSAQGYASYAHVYSAFEPVPET